MHLGVFVGPIQMPDRPRPNLSYGLDAAQQLHQAGHSSIVQIKLSATWWCAGFVTVWQIFKLKCLAIICQSCRVTL